MIVTKLIKLKNLSLFSHNILRLKLTAVYTEFTVLETKGLWVIYLFVHQNENNVTSLVEFHLFGTLLAKHSVLVYAFENINQNALDCKTANCS